MRVELPGMRSMPLQESLEGLLLPTLCRVSIQEVGVSQPRRGSQNKTMPAP